MSLINRIVRKLVPKYRKSSYSQCGEDLIVKFLFENFFKIENPTYMDIGANHPRKISNTYLFYRNKCHGVLIEPDPALYKMLVSKRAKRDMCLNIGIGKTNSLLEFYRMSVPALNTFSQKEAMEAIKQDVNLKIVEVIKVEVKNLNDVLEEIGYVPDFVSIDVEGLDLEIVESVDFDRFRPKVFCVETVGYKTDQPGTKNMEIKKSFEKNGYKVYADTYINTVFIDDSL